MTQTSPESLGAKCSECPLAEHRNPVFPEESLDTPKIVVLGENPGGSEYTTGKPISGASGFELNKALKKFGVYRSDCHVTHALLCKPSKHCTPTEWKQALAACRPRLEKELESFTSAPILSLGKRALQSATGKAEVTIWRGSPHKTDLGSGVLLPTLSAGPTTSKQLNIWKQPWYRPIFYIDVQRAALLARGKLAPWTWPKFAYDTEEIRDLLRRYIVSGRPLAVDVETNSLDSLTATLTHIGVADTESGFSWIWDPKDFETISLLQQAFSSCPLVMHNGNYDVEVLRQHGFELKCSFDTMIAHMVAAPRLPHKLEFVASAEFPLEKWKTKRKAGLMDMAEYNAKDVYTTALLHFRLSSRLDNTHNGWEIFEDLMELSKVLMEMRARGVRVDPEAQRRHSEKLSSSISEQIDNFYRLKETIPGTEKISLGKNGQHPSLKKLYFDIFKIQPKSYSPETGKPKLEGDHIKELRTTPGIIGEISKTIIQIRNESKLLSTYVNNLDYDDELICHPYWGLGPVTGRLKCSAPNVMNVPRAMRDLFVARPGKVIVKADVSGFEAALIALYAGDEGILEEYYRGDDLHKNRMRELFGFVPDNPEEFEALRNFTKTAVYLMQYGGQPQGMFRRMLPIFPNITLRKIKKIHRAFFQAHPKYREFHNYLEDIAETKDFVEEPLSGRREYFYNKVELSKVFNFPAQAGAATLMNRAILGVYSDLDWPEEGIIFQVHDELNLEGPDEQRLAKILVAHMTQKVSYRGRSLRLRIDLKRGTCWKDLEVMAQVWSPQEIDGGSRLVPESVCA